MVIIKDFLTPEEGIRHEEPQTTLYISDKEIGKGTLYITERYILQNKIFSFKTLLLQMIRV